MGWVGWSREIGESVKIVMFAVGWGVTVEDIAQHLEKRSLRWTDHIFERLAQRGIRMDDVIVALGNGEIIEQYPNDYPFPSCLVLGHGRTDSSCCLRFGWCGVVAHHCIFP